MAYGKYAHINRFQSLKHASEIDFLKVVRRPCISTVRFRTQQFATTRKFTTLHCCNKYTSNVVAVTVVTE